MSEAYKKAHERLIQARKGITTADGKPGDKSDKAKIANEIRQMERESARSGVVLSAVYRGDKVIVETRDAPSKRSLQEEYCRKFDGEKQVEINGKPTTLRKYHEDRLLRR